MAGRQRRVVAAFAGGLFLALLSAALIVAFQKTPACVRFTPSVIGQKEFRARPCMFIDTRDTIYVARLATSLGPITLILDPILAPVDVNNFVFLARAGVFDGTTFHRVENTADHALVQGGDPTGTGRGNAGYTYHGTAPSPIVRYQRGVVAIANTGSLSSNGSQFFIVVRDYEKLRSGPHGIPNYSFIGIVDGVDSFDTLDRMVAVPLSGTRPVTDIVVSSVRIQEVPRDKSTQGPPAVLPTPS